VSDPVTPRPIEPLWLKLETSDARYAVTIPLTIEGVRIAMEVVNQIESEITETARQIDNPDDVLVTPVPEGEKA